MLVYYEEKKKERKKKHTINRYVAGDVPDIADNIEDDEQRV